MKGYKTAAVAALGLIIGLGSVSIAVAKGHDQGVADGSRLDPSIYRTGAVAGIDVTGIGFAIVDKELCESGFCGVIGDVGQTYGLDSVIPQVEAGTISVNPVVNGQR